MRACPELAAEVKKRKADRQARTSSRQSINLFIDNFGDEPADSGSDGEHDQIELAAYLTELHLALSHRSSPLDNSYINSGATKHISGQRDTFNHLASSHRSKVSTAGGETLQVAGRGDVEIPTTSRSIKIDHVFMF